jgi:DNA-binding protein HU-beta
MNKRELIQEMAESIGETQTVAGQALESLLDSIQTGLMKGNGKVMLPGFGTFSKVHRKARAGVNPATGEKIRIDARNAVKFVPGKALKDAVA